jgi:hypothetical protein
MNRLILLTVGSAAFLRPAPSGAEGLPDEMRVIPLTTPNAQSLPPEAEGITAGVSIGPNGTLTPTLINTSDQSIGLDQISVEMPSHPGCDHTIPSIQLRPRGYREWRHQHCVNNMPPAGVVNMARVGAVQLLSIGAADIQDLPGETKDATAPNIMTLSITLDQAHGARPLELKWRPWLITFHGHTRRGR